MRRGRYWQIWGEVKLGRYRNVERQKWGEAKIVKSRYGERRKYAISIGKIGRGKHRGVTPSTCIQPCFPICSRIKDQA